MRVEGLRYRDEWIPNYYPSRQVGPDHWLRLSRVGTTQILSAAEDAQLSEIFMTEELYERLERTGHVVTAANAQRTMAALKTWHAGTFGPPRLHIVVLTKRCNLNCTYCHMNPEAIGTDPATFDMQREVIDAVLDFACAIPTDRIHFEFQGGEPFLNFAGMEYFVEEAERRAPQAGIKPDFSVVSNLMLVRDEHMDFCRAHRINVAYSLNGPRDVHDFYRRTRSGSGSFRIVVSRLQHLQERYPDVLSTSPLCVVGAHNSGDLIRMVDFYHEQGFKGVAILKLKNLGNAARGGVPFDIREFLDHYIGALDYIYEKNRRLDESFAERHLRVLVAKVLSKSDVGYVDWRNPNGDFSGAVTYDYDGMILPSDEARSLRPAFELGNVRDVTYDLLVRDRETFRSMNLSLRDRDSECRECTFNPFCGVLPVLDYSRTGDPTPRPHESEECLQTIAVLDWLFRKMVEDPLPLFRMLPGMEERLVAMANRSAA